MLDKEKEEGKDLWADSAYKGNDQDKAIEKHKMNNQVHEKGSRNKPTHPRTKRQQQWKIKDKGKGRACFRVHRREHEQVLPKLCRDKTG